MSKKDNIKITTNDLCVFYDEKQALFDVNISINEKETMHLLGHLMWKIDLTKMF